MNRREFMVSTAVAGAATILTPLLTTNGPVQEYPLGTRLNGMIYVKVVGSAPRSYNEMVMRKDIEL